MTNDELIEAVISLLTTDGSLNQRELRFLADVCKRLNIAEKTRIGALARAKHGQGRVCLPENEADQKRLVYFLIQAVAVDGMVVPEERMILEELVDLMGMSREYVEKFLQTRLKEIKAETYAGAKQTATICPKCGHEQMTAYQCKRCGIIFEKYKQAKAPDDVDKLMEILASSNEIKGKI